MERDLICIDLSIVPEMDVDIFFKILHKENLIFYDSRLNPNAAKPYQIDGKVSSTGILDLSEEQNTIKFELLKNQLKEEPTNESGE